MEKCHINFLIDSESESHWQFSFLLSKGSFFCHSLFNLDLDFLICKGMQVLLGLFSKTVVKAQVRVEDVTRW